MLVHSIQTFIDQYLRLSWCHLPNAHTHEPAKLAEFAEHVGLHVIHKALVRFSVKYCYVQHTRLGRLLGCLMGNFGNVQTSMLQNTRASLRPREVGKPEAHLETEAPPCRAARCSGVGAQ